MPLGLVVIGFRESQDGGITRPDPALLYSWKFNRHLQLGSILGPLTEVLLALRPFGVFILAVWIAHRFASYKLALATLGLAAAGIGFRLSQHCTPHQAPESPGVDCFQINQYAAGAVMFAVLLAMFKGVSDLLGQDRIEQDRAWRAASSVLEDSSPWQLGIQGTYARHPARVSAVNTPVPGSYGGESHVYTVAIAVPPGGWSWSIRPTRWWKAQVESSSWTVRSWRPGLPALLRHEGLEELVRQAQTSLDLDAKPKIAYRSIKGTLTYRDSSGTVPTTDRLGRHLDLLVGLAELNAKRNRRPLLPGRRRPAFPAAPVMRASRRPREAGR